jgi:hypothetical protein
MIRSSEFENDDTWFYNEVMDVAINYLEKNKENYARPIYGLLKRINAIHSYESNLNHGALVNLIELA